MRPLIARPTFNTREYRWSHGREPRGRGSWAFGFRASSGPVPNPAEPEGSPLRNTWWAPADRPYSEAKRWALAKARKLGAVEVIVCP